MGARFSSSLWIPTAGSTTQVEEVGYAPASGFQDARVRALGVGVSPVIGQSGILSLSSAGLIGWDNGGGSTSDTGLSRVSAAVLAIGQGSSSNATGTLRVTTVQAPSATTLNLGGGAASQVAIETDGAIVQTVSGTGNGSYFASFNGGTSGARFMVTATTYVPTGTGFSYIPQITDTTAIAANVGGRIGFAGESNTGAYNPFVQIGAKKLNATVNDMRGHFVVTHNTATTATNTGLDTFAVSHDAIIKTVSGGVFGGTSSATDPTAAADWGISRTAAATVALGNGTAADASGSVLCSRSQVDRTTDLSVGAGASNTLYTNTGASGTVNFTLPTAAVGLQYTFIVNAAQTLRVTAGASTTITVGNSASAAAGNIANASVGSAITLHAVSTTSWIASSATGTWTVT